MMKRTAARTESVEVRVVVAERGIREGLNVGHLRAFVGEANLAGIGDDVRVYLTDKLQSAGAYHDIEIAASVRTSQTLPIGAEEATE